MFIVARLTNQLTQAARLAGQDETGALSNRLGDVIEIRDGDHEHSETELTLFAILDVPDLSEALADALIESDFFNLTADPDKAQLLRQRKLTLDPDVFAQNCKGFDPKNPVRVLKQEELLPFILDSKTGNPAKLKV